MSHTAPTASAASQCCRARRRRPSAAAGRDRPLLRIVPDFSSPAADLSPGELVADLAVLLDARVVTVVVDMVGEPRYAVVKHDDLFTGTGTTPIATCSNGGVA